MKLIFIKSICFFLFLFAFNTIFAQAPQKMSYQAVIRNTSGNLIVDTPVGIKISILQGSTSGTEVFSEIHNPTTSSNGLASIEIGAGTPITGTFATINWGLGPFFIKTETDPTGGTNYTMSGTSQLLSVPYALYAEKTKFQGRNSIYIQGNISNAQAQAILQEQFGPNTENIYVKNTNGLTNLDLSMVTNLTNLEITNNKDLVSLNTDNLSNCYNSILISGNNLLTQIYLPILQEANNVSLSGYAVQSIQLQLYNNGNVVLGGNTLQLIQLPQFTTGNFSISNSGIQTFQLPQFTNGDVSITGCSALQTFQLPQFTTGNFNLKNNSVISFDMPQYITGDVVIDGNGFLLQVYLPLFNSPNIDIKICNALEIINLPSVTTLQKIKLQSSRIIEVINGLSYSYPTIADLPNLEQVLFPSLTTVTEFIEIKGSNIDTISMPSLTTVTEFIEIKGSNIVTISMPSLAITESINISGSNIVTISMPLLVSVAYLTIENTKITSLNTTSLFSANLIQVKNNNFLQSINFGSLDSANAINCSFNPSLTSINLSSLSSLASSATNFSYFAYNALPSSQINAILHQLLTVSPSVPKTVGLDHQTPLAPPTGVGITDKVTLISQGNNIATD